jgi:hypothetical protein
VQYLRLSVACVSALVCLGASNVGASPDGRSLGGPTLLVQICAPNALSGNCGPQPPKVLGGQLRDNRFPALAKRAGVVSVRGLKITCPGTCEVERAVTVTLTARPTQDPSRGSYEFDGWEGDCRSFGKRPCTLRVNGKMVAKALFHPVY